MPTLVPHVEEIALDDPRAYGPLPGGGTIRVAKSLREAREQFGGDEFALPINMLGHDSVLISLAEFRDRDPDDTYVVIGWKIHYTYAEAVTLEQRQYDDGEDH